MAPDNHDEHHHQRPNQIDERTYFFDKHGNAISMSTAKGGEDLLNSRRNGAKLMPTKY
jgi:hypothetical protein